MPYTFTLLEAIYPDAYKPPGPLLFALCGRFTHTYRFTGTVIVTKR